MKKIKTDTTLLPLEAMANVAGYIPDWTTLKHFVEALHSVKVLGPLEQFLQLESRGINHTLFWPYLDLTRMTIQQRVHVQDIMKCHSNVVVNNQVDVSWFRQHINPKASIHCSGGTRIGYYRYITRSWMNDWKEFRIISFDPWAINVNANDFPQLLVDFKHLVSLQWKYCSSAVAEAIFEFAASSSTLRDLFLNNVESWSVTESMGNNLIQWVRSGPIRSLQMERYIFEKMHQHDQLIALVSGKPSVGKFEFFPDIGSCPFFYVDYAHCKSLSLSFRMHAYPSVEIAANKLSGFVSQFETLIHTKIKRFHLSGLGPSQFRIIWEILASLLPTSNIEEMDLPCNKIDDIEANLLAQSIHNMPSLQSLWLDRNDIRFDGAKNIITTAPASVRKIILRWDELELEQSFAKHKYSALKKLADKRSIKLFREDDPKLQ
ncbi:hypothetical protein AeRB84_006412 [Aphanomyces euteiches]|nr:hypothetical protein AeRB84_006412 [Aphanomyces euteiches]